jgi:hypothetical protein
MDAQLGPDDAPLTEENREDLLLDFEQETINDLVPKFEGAASTQYGAGKPLEQAGVMFWNGRTILDAVEDTSVPPQTLMILIPLILGIYVQLNFAKLGTDPNSMLYSRMYCFSTLVTIVCMATAAATGVCSLMFKLGPANVISVPFVALGIGIDDAYVLMYTVCYVVQNEDPEERIAQTLQVAGSAVLLTSTTNFFTLLVCLLTPNYSLQTFSAHLAICVFFNLLFLLLLGVPVMYLDVLRTHVWKRADVHGMFAKVPNALPETEVTTQTITEMIGTIFKNTIAPTVLAPAGKAFVILVSLGWFGAMVHVGQTEDKLGLLISDFTSEGDYSYAAADQVEFFYPTWPAVRVTTDIEYGLPVNQEAMIAGATACDNSKWTAKTSSGQIAWFNGNPTSLMDQVPTFDGTTATVLPDAETFWTVYGAWVSALGSLYSSQLYCEDTTTGEAADCLAYTVGGDIALKGAYDTFFLVEQRDTPDMVDAILVRAKCTNVGV